MFKNFSLLCVVYLFGVKLGAALEDFTEFTKGLYMVSMAMMKFKFVLNIIYQVKYNMSYQAVQQKSDKWDNI